MGWKKTTRATGLIEWVCEHGIGHPDYESAERVAGMFNHKIETWLSHGCDGCCNDKDFPGRKKK